MISIAMLSGGEQAAVYYLDRDADCGARYYTDERLDAGYWCGDGATALGLTGPVDGLHREVFARLLAGRLPHGTQIGRPVLRPDARGLLPTRPLLDAITTHARTQRADPASLFTAAADRDQYAELAGAAAAVGRTTTARLDAKAVGRLAAAAGLDPVAVYSAAGTDHYSAALRYAGRQVDHRRAGLDVTVSPPKSVSVLAALADEPVRQQIVFAHQAAVAETVEYLQQHTAHGLRGHQGNGQRATRITTAGFVAAAFTHHLSRANDPQLHTHLVLINLLHGKDGKWSAVDSQAVFRHARTAGALYQACLRGQLTRRLGIEWGPVHRSVAEITGIPAAVRRAFSTQRQRIEQEIEHGGSDSRQARQRAAYRTRPNKTHTNPDALRARWRATVTELGYDPQRLLGEVLGRRVTLQVSGPGKTPGNHPGNSWGTHLVKAASQLLGPDGLTATQTTFVRRDLTRALADQLPAGLPLTAATLEALTDKMLTHPHAIQLEAPAAGGEAQWTTADLLDSERRALRHARRQLPHQVLDTDRIVELVTSSRLNAEQQRVAINLAVSPAAVQVVLGPAGSGKTTVLATAARAWHINGRPILGTALAAVTAQRLQTATGIPSHSLTRLLAAADQTDPNTSRSVGLPPGVAVVVDEASMVGTRQLTRLLDHLERADGCLVLVGDPAQLPEIEAGGLFTAFAAQSMSTHVLGGNTRQVSEWERRALADLRAGAVHLALGQYLDHQRIHISSTPDELTTSLSRDYLTRRETHGSYGVVALASRRADVQTLNTTIRSRLQTKGIIQADDAVVITGSHQTRIPLAVRDLVMVTVNDPATGLLNGTRAELTQVSAKQLSLHTEDGRHVTVPTRWATGRLTHAYALTIHKAQGLTVQECLLYGTSALCQQAGYVALSRGRHANHLYTTLTSLDANRQINPSGFQLLTGPDPAHVLDALADRLTRGHTHTLAAHQRPRDDHNRLHVRDVAGRDYGIER